MATALRPFKRNSFKRNGPSNALVKNVNLNKPSTSAAARNQMQNALLIGSSSDSSDSEGVEVTGSQAQSIASTSSRPIGVSVARKSVINAFATSKGKKRKSRSSSFEIINSSAREPSPKRQRTQIMQPVQDSDASSDGLEIISPPKVVSAQSKGKGKARTVDSQDDSAEDDLPPPSAPPSRTSTASHEPQLIDSRSSSVCEAMSPVIMPSRMKTLAPTKSKPALARNSSGSKASSTTSKSSAAFWDDNNVTMIQDSPPASPFTPPSDDQSDLRHKVQDATEQVGHRDSESPPPLLYVGAYPPNSEKQKRLTKLREETLAVSKRRQSERILIQDDSDDSDEEDVDDIMFDDRTSQQQLGTAAIPDALESTALESRLAALAREMQMVEDKNTSSRDPSPIPGDELLVPENRVPDLHLDSPMEVDVQQLKVEVDVPLSPAVAIRVCPPTNPKTEIQPATLPPTKPPTSPVPAIPPVASQASKILYIRKHITIALRRKVHHRHNIDPEDSKDLMFPQKFRLPISPSLTSKGKTVQPTIEMPTDQVKRRQLPFLARNMIPFTRPTWQGKFLQLHIHLGQMGFASSLARVLSPPDIYNGHVRSAIARHDLHYVFGRCGHHTSLDNFRFEGLKCCWCIEDENFATVGALLSHLRTEHEACEFSYKELVCNVWRIETV